MELFDGLFSKTENTWFGLPIAFVISIIPFLIISSTLLIHSFFFKGKGYKKKNNSSGKTAA